MIQRLAVQLRVAARYLGLLGLPWILAGCAGNGAVGRPPTGDVLYSDGFVLGQTGEWLTERDERGYAAVQNAQLLIELNMANTLQFSSLKEPLFDDFVLEVDVTQLAGSPESSFGVLFRMQGPRQFYRFDITGSGLFVVERHNADGTWTRLLDDWTPSAAIIQGVNATNRLRVIAEGSELEFHVNSQPVLELSDSAYSSGQIALDAATFGQTGLQVAFDNLVVREP